MGKWTLSYHGLIGLLLVVLAAVHQWNPSAVQRLRSLAFDTYQRLSPRVYDPSLPVRIVDIDEASLAKRGQWPWPRTELAALVQKLEEMGAVAIVFDMVFPEPDRLSPAEIAKRLQSSGRLSGDLAASLSAEASNDQIFGDAIAKSGVVLGFAGAPDAASSALPPRPFEIDVKGDDPGLFVPSFQGAVQNLAVLSEKAPGSGSINWVAEQDQIIRKLPLFVRIKDQLYPSIAAEGMRIAQGVANYLIVSSGGGSEEAFGTRTGISRVLIGNARIPTDAFGQMWLRFTPTDPRRFISASAILDGSASPDAVQQKIVLIGTSAAGLLDIRATPLDAAVAGVEAHAQALEQMLTGQYLTRPDLAPGLEIVLTLLAGAVLAWAIYRTGALLGLVFAAAAIGIGAGASWMFFQHAGWLIDPVYPSMSLASVYLVGASFLRARTELERNRIRHAFGHYMAPAQVERLAADHSHLMLGGENRELTLLFSDVRGFTRRSEKLDPQSLTRFVIDLFTPLSTTILQNAGTIDKFIGDAVMAFWNAPLDDPDHARQACRAALAMLKDMDELNAGWKAATPSDQVYEPVSIGIGLNTGVCCVGNFGSEQRFDYSAIGADVNLASRIEGLTKAYGVSILVGPKTAEEAPEFAFIEADLIIVKGYQTPVRVYALLGDQATAQDPQFLAMKAKHDAMVAAFRAQRFDEATGVLADLMASGRQDLKELWTVYQRRIEAFRISPPPPDWDGRMAAEGK